MKSFAWTLIILGAIGIAESGLSFASIAGIVLTSFGLSVLINITL